MPELVLKRKYAEYEAYERFDIIIKNLIKIFIGQKLNPENLNKLESEIELSLRIISKIRIKKNKSAKTPSFEFFKKIFDIVLKNNQVYPYFNYFLSLMNAYEKDRSVPLYCPKNEDEFFDIANQELTRILENLTKGETAFEERIQVLYFRTKTISKNSF